MSAFIGGLLQPLLVPLHGMAVLVLGLLIGGQLGCSGRRPLPVYAIALTGGLTVISLGVVPVLADEVLLVVSAVSGLLVAWGRRLPRLGVSALAAATGLAFALDSPPETISLREANLTLLGTACGAIIALTAIVEAAAWLPHGWPRTGARILGSWIAASAILVLALVLER